MSVLLGAVVFTASFSALGLQQFMKRNLQKTRFYTRLLSKLSSELEITSPILVSKQQLFNTSTEQILQNHKSHMTKQTAEKLSLIQKFKQQKYMDKHFLACTIFGLGCTMSPLFIIPCVGYAGYYHYYMYGRLAHMKLDLDVPFTQNFESVHFLISAACGAALVTCAGVKGMGLLRRMRTGKSLVERKN